METQNEISQFTLKCLTDQTAHIQKFKPTVKRYNRAEEQMKTIGMPMMNFNRNLVSFSKTSEELVVQSTIESNYDEKVSTPKIPPKNKDELLEEKTISDQERDEEAARIELLKRKLTEDICEMLAKMDEASQEEDTPKKSQKIICKTSNVMHKKSNGVRTRSVMSEKSSEMNRKKSGISKKNSELKKKWKWLNAMKSVNIDFFNKNITPTINKKCDFLNMCTEDTKVKNQCPKFEILKVDTSKRFTSLLN